MLDEPHFPRRPINKTEMKLCGSLKQFNNCLQPIPQNNSMTSRTDSKMTHSGFTGREFIHRPAC